MSRSKCLAILCLSITAPTASAISASPRSGIALARDRGLDAGEVALGGGEQVLALAGALGGEIGVAADDQAFAGEVGCGDAGHVALIEQRQLQGAARQQLLDRRRA